jgi:ABC-type oligopeptide transport system substrate-binding subunit
MRSRSVAVVVTGALALAACSAGTKGTAATTSTAGAHSRSTTSTTSPPATAPPAPSQATTTTAVSQTSNVVVTDEVRAELVAAGAALNSLAPSDYTGLVAGETYYAYDATTKTYWAGAGLVPSPSSTQAQVSAQDDGAYLVFERPPGGPWKAYAVGLAGTREGGACPVTVPAAVLGLWNWAPQSCRPATI